MADGPTLTEFYNGRRVLVTGHTGFKGSWLCLWLLQMGCQVAGYALAPEKTPDSLYDLSKLSLRIHSQYADIRDFSALHRFVRGYQPEIVFHMAAQPLVLPSYAAPVDTFGTNIMGTVCLLEAARQAGSVRSIVNVTTDKCYENNESSAAFRESDPLGGYDPYSSSKAAAEIVSAAYRRSFLADAKISMATARAGNVIGGGDFSPHRLIPDVIRAAKSGQSVNLRHPGSIRPWQYVLDVLHGYLLLGRALFEKGAAYAEAFNFGPDEAGITVGAVADRLAAAIANSPPLMHVQGGSEAHEARTLYLDNRKAKSALDWYPLVSPHEAIDLTAAWFCHYLSHPDPIAGITDKQLADYMKKIAV